MAAVKQDHKTLVIGGSAGSLTRVLQLLPFFTTGLNIAIVLVFHRRETDDSSLVELLSRRSKLQVKEADEKETIQPGTIYVAPTDYHLLIEKDNTFSLDYSEKVNYCRPSIDVTFESAADALQKSLVALLLSGANDDGTRGLMAVKEAGGIVVIQDPLTAEVAYMPQYALNRVKADLILQDDSPQEFISLLSGA